MQKTINLYNSKTKACLFLLLIILSTISFSQNNFRTSEDTIIQTAPYFESFDDTTTNVPLLTTGWHSIHGYWGSVESTSEDFYSGPNSIILEFPENIPSYYNNTILISPLITIDPNAVIFKFQGKGNTKNKIDIGIMTDRTNSSTFSLLKSIELLDEFENYSFCINSIVTSEPYYIAFKGQNLNNSIQLEVFIDDFKIIEAPMDTSIVLSDNIWNTGTRPVSYTSLSPTYTLTNFGQNSITIYNTTDLSDSPFSSDFNSEEIVIEFGQTYEFTFNFTPTEIGSFTKDFIIESSSGVDTIQLIGKSEYELPDNIVEIGWDTVSFSPSLPMVPTTKYSVSSCNYMQENINVDGQAIYKIYYRQKSQTHLNDAIQIYFDDFLVYDGYFGSPDEDGWVEITLDNPYIYTNADYYLNIKFVDNGENTYSSQDEFYQHATINSDAGYRTSNEEPIELLSPMTNYFHKPNIRLEFGELPSEPNLYLNTHTWDAGAQPNNSGDIFKIINTGTGTLNLTDVTLTNGDAFSTSIIPSEVELETYQEYNFHINFHPITLGLTKDTLIINTTTSSDTIFLSGNAETIDILEFADGNGHSIFPFNPYYGYSFGQSIFHQEELLNQRLKITKLYFQKYNLDSLENSGDISIYFSHTELSEFLSNSIVESYFLSSFIEELPQPDQDGWIEFKIDFPFIYNNIDNLVITLHEEKEGFDDFDDQFKYHYPSRGDISRYMNNDFTNYSPLDNYGTANTRRANIRIQYELLPDYPELLLYRDTIDFGSCFTLETNLDSFLIINSGTNLLTINNIYIGGENADQFEIFNNPNFPFEQDNTFENQYNLQIGFSPTTGGESNATLYFEHSEGTDSITLTGLGEHVSIDTLPYYENFDNPETTTTPELTRGWAFYSDTISSTDKIASTDYNAYSLPNSILFSIQNNDRCFMLIGPPTNINPNETQLSFCVKQLYYPSSSSNVIVGYLTDKTDTTSFFPIDTLESSGLSSIHSIDLSTINVTGTWYFAFKNLNTDNTSRFLLDNIAWTEITQEPLFYPSHSAMHFDSTSQMTCSIIKHLRIHNLGNEELVITDIYVEGQDSPDFEINVLSNLNDTIANDVNDSFSVDIRFCPLSVGNKSAVLNIIDNNQNTYPIPLYGISIEAGIMYADTLVDFNEGLFIPPFWRKSSLRRLQLGLNAYSPTDYMLGYAWRPCEFANVPTNSMAQKLNLYYTGLFEWFITPPIYIGEGEYPAILEFDIAKTAYNSQNESENGPDNKFAVLLKTKYDDTWDESNVIRMWDNTGSDYILDSVPNGEGEHVQITLANYSGFVKIAFYGESTEYIGDSDLFIDNFEVSILNLEEIDSLTSMSVSPESINDYQSENTDTEITFITNYPENYIGNANSQLKQDYLLSFDNFEIGTSLHFFDNETEIGQLNIDGIQTTYWLSDVLSQSQVPLNEVTDDTLTIRILNSTNTGNHTISLSTYTAVAGEFNTTPILLAENSANINIYPEPVNLPLEEDFSVGFPNNWLSINNTNNGAEWHYVNDNQLNSSSGENGYMQINDLDSDQSSPTNSSLITMPIDISEANNLIILEFEHYYQHVTSDTASLLLSTNLGNSWEIIDIFTSTTGSPNNPSFASYDLTEQLAEADNFIIAWNFNDNNSIAQNWSVDDVHVFEYIPSSDTEILSFEIPGQINSFFNSNIPSIDIIMPLGTAIGEYTPTFTLSQGADATINGDPQVSGFSSVDFSNSMTQPVIYTITAEDGITTENWEITVSPFMDISSEDNFEFTIYPNPSDGEIIINAFSENDFSYSIFASNGQLIYEENVLSKGFYSNQMKIHSEPGLYIIKICVGDLIRYTKLIIR